MSKKLVLAEKPSVARDLAQVLGATQKNRNYFEGPQYIVTWALGHLLSLKMPEDIKPEWKTWSLETLPMLPKKWENIPLPKTGGQLKAIQQLARRQDVSGGVIATDSGREGELVAREIFNWVRFNKPLERLWISSQTTKAIQTGFTELAPAKKYDNLYQSAVARSKADWLVGLNVTRALTVKYQDNLSAGRVQTPTLASVNGVEETIAKFIPQTYFTIQLRYQNEIGNLLTDKPQRFLTREEAEKFLAPLAGKIGHVAELKETEKHEKAPLPYDLTEIQRVANAKYQFSAKKTLSLVQSLYETHKIVSYPRTDSKYLPRDVEQTLAERLQALVGFDDRAKKVLQKGAKVTLKSVFNDSKVTDHYALIPTEERAQVAKLSTDEMRIYRLIVERFLGLFAEDHVERQTKVVVTFGKEAAFTFKQSAVVQAGFKADDSLVLPSVTWTKATTFKADFQINKALTQPPKLMTEGGLLGYMEKNSLGTPATRAEIIEKLIKSELMERNCGTSSLRVTPKGKQLLKLVNPSLITPALTSKWEQQLEGIAKGPVDGEKFISGIVGDTKMLVKEIVDSKVDYQDFALTNKKCPECGAALREKNTRDGKILVCSSPDCNYRRRLEAKVSNHRCPQCHKKMEILDGKNGAYFRCKYDGTTEKMLDKKTAGNKKMNKHEEKRLLQKVNQEAEPVESPLAAALKAAMEKNK